MWVQPSVPLWPLCSTCARGRRSGEPEACTQCRTPGCFGRTATAAPARFRTTGCTLDPTFAAAPGGRRCSGSDTRPASSARSQRSVPERTVRSRFDCQALQSDVCRVRRGGRVGPRRGDRLHRDLADRRGRWRSGGDVTVAVSSQLRVLVAGGGVAGLETLLALRHLAGDRIERTLLTPEPEFVYRPMAVAEPFSRGRAQRHRLDTDRRRPGRSPRPRLPRRRRGRITVSTRAESGSCVRALSRHRHRRRIARSARLHRYETPDIPTGGGCASHRKLRVHDRKVRHG